MTADESPKMLTQGAWLPGRNGVLHWAEGVPAAKWQDTRFSRCGSLTGADHHRQKREPLCDLCLATQREYRLIWQQARKRRKIA